MTEERGTTVDNHLNDKPQTLDEWKALATALATDRSLKLAEIHSINENLFDQQAKRYHAENDAKLADICAESANRRYQTERDVNRRLLTNIDHARSEIEKARTHAMVAYAVAFILAILLSAVGLS